MRGWYCVGDAHSDTTPCAAAAFQRAADAEKDRQAKLRLVEEYK